MKTARTRNSARTSSTGPRARAPAPADFATEAAVIEAVGERLRVRRIREGASRDVVDARLARLPGYEPHIGDRVVASFGPDESYVIAVLHAATPSEDQPSLVLPDGARAAIAGEGLELRDARGRLLVRYHAGHAEIAAPSGDLHLIAPQGRVTIESALDVSVTSGRDVTVGAARRCELTADGTRTRLGLEPKRATLHSAHVEVTSQTARLATGKATLLARSIATTAEHLAQRVTKYELVAERLVERTKDAFRDASDLAQTRVGRLRTIVEDTFSLRARRTTLLSSDETSIDGKKVLLG